MFKERPNQLWTTRKMAHLLINSLGQFFAFLQRPSSHAGALCMAPHQLIGIQLRGVPRQKMQRQLAIETLDVGLDHLALVRRQSVHDQMQGPATTMHQFPQQLHECVSFQSALIQRVPERALAVHGRRRADALALSWAVHDGGIASLGPGLAVNGIGPEAGLIPEVNVRFLRPRPLSQCWIHIALPGLYRFRIALVGAFQWLLRRQTYLGEQLPNGADTQGNGELLQDQFANDLPRPQAKIKAVLKRVLSVDPLKDLLLLLWRQLSRSTSACAHGKGLGNRLIIADPGTPFVESGATQPQALHDCLDWLSIANSLHREDTQRSFGLAIVMASVLFHGGCSSGYRYIRVQTIFPTYV